MKRLLEIGACLALIFGMAIFFIGKENGKTAELAKCYHGIVGDSNSVFTVESNKAGKINGRMAFIFAQKDSSYGTYKGTYENGKLKVVYHFYSEAVWSDGDYEFVRSPEGFTGSGYKYLPSIDCEMFLRK
jgi:hypothetical protein